MLGPLGSIGLSQSSGMGSGIGGWWEGGGTGVLPEVELSCDGCSCLYMDVSPASK